MSELKEYVDINAEWHKRIDSIWPEAPDLTFNPISIPMNELKRTGNSLHFDIMDIYAEHVYPLVSEFEQPHRAPDTHIGPIHALERQTSICTNQGGEETCYAHADAKLFLQNIYGFVSPIRVTDIEKFHSCFDALKTDIEHDYTTLSVERCGSGYFKILLFLYLYCIIKPRKLMSFEELLPIIVEIPVEIPDIEKFSVKQKMDIDSFREDFKRTINVRGLVWDTFTVSCNPDTIPFLNEIIIPILNLGFYIGIVLIGHSLIIVKHRKHLGQDFFGISNSWGEQVDNTSNLTEIHLNGDLFKTSHFRFVLPFCVKEGQYNILTTPLPIIPLPRPPMIPAKIFFTEKTIDKLLEWIPEYCEDIEQFKSIRIPNGGKKTRTKKNKRSKKKYLRANKGLDNKKGASLYRE